MKNKYYVSLYIFLIFSILIFVVGLILLINSSRNLSALNEIENSGLSEEAKVIDIISRNRASENTIRLELNKTNEIKEINIAKLFDNNIKIGDNVTVFFSSKDEEKYIVKEFIGKIKVTYVLRYIAVVVCLLMAYFLFRGFLSINREIKKMEKN